MNEALHEGSRDGCIAMVAAMRQLYKEVNAQLGRDRFVDDFMSLALDGLQCMLRDNFNENLDPC
jgi:hypothetical protein